MSTILDKFRGADDEVYDSAARPHPLIEELIALFKYKELIVQFVSRSIKTRYKRSFLGVVWTMLNPLLTMIVLTLVFANLFRFQIENYAVYILSGLIVWSFFSTSTSTAMGEMIWSGNLLNRIYVPKSVFAVSAVGTGLYNLVISMVPLFLITLVLGVNIGWEVLVMPFAILLLAIFSLGIGLILATAAVYFADMLPVYEVVLTIWMYATPIIYPLEIVPPNLRWVFQLNPLYYLLEAFRLPLFNQVVPGPGIWIPAIFVSLAALIAGGLFFTANSNEYAYRI
jgi:ABC-type polysaccharide/polyol phosphate export permease